MITVQASHRAPGVCQRRVQRVPRVLGTVQGAVQVTGSFPSSQWRLAPGWPAHCASTHILTTVG
jgi:hypothetical protein